MEKPDTGSLESSLPSKGEKSFSSSTLGNFNQLFTDQLASFKMGELGYKADSINAGVYAEPAYPELDWNKARKTYKAMLSHATISASEAYYRKLLSKGTFTVTPHPKASKRDIKRAEYISQMMDDMEHSFVEFIMDAASCRVFGFSLHEKVFRKRTYSNGSNFDDGLIGWRKLPIRRQESIERFIFSEDGNNVLGARQNLGLVPHNYRQGLGQINLEEKVKNIPASKLLHFRYGANRGSPFGRSALDDVFLAYKYLVTIEELEAQGVSKDLNGLPVIYVPAQVLSRHADAETQAQREYWENIIRNINMNAQSGLIMPSFIDPETRQSLYKIELLSVDGKKNYDTEDIKQYYKNLILTGLGTSVLTMGQTTTGSFALGQLASSFAVDTANELVRNILDVLNRDLIPQTYKLNGWSLEKLPKFDVDGIENEDLEVFSKAVQRMYTAGVLPKTHEVINSALHSLGLDPLDVDINLDDVLPESTSNSGKGMATPFEGTRTQQTPEEGADSNSENVA